MQQIADIQGSDYSHNYTSFTSSIPTLLPILDTISWTVDGEFQLLCSKRLHQRLKVISVLDFCIDEEDFCCVSYNHFIRFRDNHQRI